MKITLTHLASVLSLLLLIFACSKSSSSGTPKPYATCASANLGCAKDGTCPTGQGYASGDVVMTCDGTDNGEPCCQVCNPPNEVQDNACVFGGVVKCTNLGGYCASPPDDDASPSSTAKCDPGTVTIGTPGMCGNGKDYPLADCCGDMDGGDQGDDGSADTGVDATPPIDASSD